MMGTAMATGGGYRTGGMIRRGSHAHWGEIFTGFAGAEVLEGHVMPRGWFGGALLGDVDDQGFVDGLSIGVVDIQRSTDGLFRAQRALLVAMFARRFSQDKLEQKVRRIERVADGITVLPQDGFPQIVDQILLGDRDQCRGAPGAFHPDLTVDHVGLEGSRLTREIV